MCGCNSISNTCGEISLAACVRFEGSLPTFTTLSAQDCYSLEEIIADIYLIETGIKNEIDLTALEDNGIDYPTIGDTILVKNALSKHAELIVALQQTVSGLTDGSDGLFSITDWGLDFECVADNCSNPPTELKDLLQLLITATCDLQTRVIELETP